jgi:hypothetical protein
LIILPAESTFFQIWDILINTMLFVGYFMNMTHVAFHLEEQDISYNKDYLQAVDILFAIDICLKFVTAYQKDVEWVTDIKLIILNNFKQKFIFDLTATLPCLIAK